MWADVGKKGRNGKKEDLHMLYDLTSIKTSTADKLKGEITGKTSHPLHKESEVVD